MGKPAAVRPSSAFTTVDLDGAGKQVSDCHTSVTSCVPIGFGRTGVRASGRPPARPTEVRASRTDAGIARQRPRAVLAGAAPDGARFADHGSLGSSV